MQNNHTRSLTVLYLLIFLFMGSLGLYQFQNAWPLVFNREWIYWAGLLVFVAIGGFLGYFVAALARAYHKTTEFIYLIGAFTYGILYALLQFNVNIDRFYLIALILFFIPFNLIMLEVHLVTSLHEMGSGQNGSWIMAFVVLLLPFLVRIVPNPGFALYSVQVYFYTMFCLIVGILAFTVYLNKTKSSQSKKDEITQNFDRNAFRIALGPTHFLSVVLLCAIFAGLTFLTYFNQSRNHFFSFLLHMAEINMYPADILVKPLFYAALCGGIGCPFIVWRLSKMKMSRWLQIGLGVLIEAGIALVGVLIYFSIFPVLDPLWMVFLFTTLVLGIILWPLSLLGFRIHRILNQKESGKNRKTP